MLSAGPMSPLPSYLPVGSSSQGATLQVPSNPFAAGVSAAIASDATAPALAYAPLSSSTTALGFASSSYVPQVAMAGMAPATILAMSPSYQPSPMVPTTTLAAPTTALQAYAM